MLPTIRSRETRKVRILLLSLLLRGTFRCLPSCPQCKRDTRLFALPVPLLDLVQKFKRSPGSQNDSAPCPFLKAAMRKLRATQHSSFHPGESAWTSQYHSFQAVLVSFFMGARALSSGLSRPFPSSLSLRLAPLPSEAPMPSLTR